MSAHTPGPATVRRWRLMRAELKVRALESLEKARADRLRGQQHEAFVYADWAASDRRRAAWFGAAIARATGASNG